jgi:hypothetical protein
MDDTLARFFFVQPADETQRLYEALRAVFVDGCRQKDVAAHFGYSFAAFRQQVHQFRAGYATGRLPPFSAHGRADVRRRPLDHRGRRNSRRWRTVVR